MNERTAMADGRARSDTFLEAARSSANAFYSADFAKLALDTGSVISAALLGGLAATNTLPFSREAFEAAIRRGGIGVDASLRAFAAGYSAVAAPTPAVTPAPAPEEHTQAVGNALIPLAQRVRKTFPESVYPMVFPAIQRLAEYQDLRYAKEYLDRLDPVRDLDAQYGDGQFTLLHETARYLALWLTYEDAIRVADLKTRKSRFDRIRKDIRARSGQLLHISEFLSPQPQEIADLLPRALGKWLLGSDVTKRMIVRFSGGGTTIQSTSAGGFLLLYLLSKLRPIRRWSLRFYVEQEEIATWLNILKETASENYPVAVEVAECGRMIKGYSDTHDLGMRNFKALMEQVPQLRNEPDGAARLQRLREAAFADDTGKALSQSLVQITL